MHSLVIGASGQLAGKLAALSRPDCTIRAIGRPHLDICDQDSIDAAIEREAPDVVINAAAYTAVDKAESDAETAFAANRDGAANVAVAAKHAGLPIIHISTDYVYSGLKPTPYLEADEPAPAGVYGRSKLEGERAVAAANDRHIIVRTAWVYSDLGSNFAKTMIRLAASRDEVGVVADQHGNPTSAADLAEGILRIANALSGNSAFEDWGVYHLCGAGDTTWAEFARRIFEVSAKCGGPSANVRDITTNDYPTPASRPSNSRLCTDKFAGRFDWRPPDWKTSVETVVRQIVENRPEN